MHSNTRRRADKASSACRLFAAASIWMTAAAALADPGYYLVTPYSKPGQAALDLRCWTVKSPNQGAILWPEVGLR